MPIFSKDGQRVASARPTRATPVQSRQSAIDQEGRSARPLERDPVEARGSAILTSGGTAGSGGTSSIVVLDGAGVVHQASQIQVDSNTGFEVVVSPDDPQRVIIREPIPVIAFSATASLNTQDSSVFTVVSSPIILTATGSGLTGLASASPTGSVITSPTISWSDVSPFLSSGSYTFSAIAQGTDSLGEDDTVSVSAGFSRFVPEFVMSAEPTVFTDFTGSRAPSSAVTAVGSPTFLATTTDYGATATAIVAGLMLNVPRVSAGVISSADQSGATHSYNVYRIGVSPGTSVTLS